MTKQPLNKQHVKLIAILAAVILLVVIVALLGNKGSEATTADGQTPGMVAVNAVERAAANNEPALEGGTTLAPETTETATESETPAPAGTAGADADEEAEARARHKLLTDRLQKRMDERDTEVARQRAAQESAKNAAQPAP